MNVAMDIIKKNMLSLICALVAILAIVAVEVWPLPGHYDAIAKDLEKRKGDLQNYESLAQKQRKLPLLDPSKTEADPLPGFPTQEMIEQGKKIQEQIASEAKSVEDLALKLNEHQPLVPGSLPNPTRPVEFQYEEAYQKVMDFQNPDPSIRNGTLPIKVLHAAMEPTADEINNERKRREAEMKDALLVPGQNDAEVTAKIAAMAQSLPEEMKHELASRSQMYMERDALDVVPKIIGSEQPPSPDLIWASQLSLWLQQDICTALAEANKNSTSVEDSAVKHLLKIDINRAPDPNTANRPAEGGEGAPAPVARGVTGRSSTNIYEVIPYRLTINVDARKVPEVLAELARNRFTTITRCDLQSVDVGAQALAGFYYGSNPVVQLHLQCETIYLKSWMSKLQPAAPVNTNQPQG